MPQTKETSRSAATQERIRASVKDLIAREQPTKINVSEIARGAGIHRKTFYLHYDTIEDLFRELLNDICQDYRAALDKLPTTFTYRDFNRAFLTFCASLDPWEERLLTDAAYSRVAEEFTRREWEMRMTTVDYDPFCMLSAPAKSLVAHFLITSAWGFYRKWVEDGKLLSPEELLDISSTLIEEGVYTLMVPHEALEAQLAGTTDE